MTVNKSYILPCLIQIPTNSRRQVILLPMSHTDNSKSRTSCHASHRYQKKPGDKSYFLPCLTQIPANHRQQIVLVAMPHTDTFKSQATSSYILPCLTQIPANHRQQIVLLAMPNTNSKSWAANRTSCHASHSTSKSQATSRTSRHLRHRSKIMVIKSYILPCLTQIPAKHWQQIILLASTHTDIRTRRQQIVLVAMPQIDTSKSQATNRTSCHVSRRYQQITGKKTYFLPCLTQIPANHRQQIVHLAMPNTDSK